MARSSFSRTGPRPAPPFACPNRSPPAAADPRVRATLQAGEQIAEEPLLAADQMAHQHLVTLRGHANQRDRDHEAPCDPAGGCQLEGEKAADRVDRGQEADVEWFVAGDERPAGGHRQRPALDPQASGRQRSCER